MICNWAGPGNSHNMTGTTELAQKQCFTKTSAESIFAPSSSNITYAPTNNCNDTGGMTYDWPAHSGDGATNDLVDLTADTDFADYTAPTAPELTSGF